MKTRPHQHVVRPRTGDHGVQFYASDDDLAGRLADYVCEGLEDGDGILAVLTHAHRDTLLSMLRKRGCGVDSAIQRGRFKLLDAAQAVVTFFADGVPDGTTLGQVLGPLLDEVTAASRNGRVRAFGEVVSLLTQAGRVSDALHLERAWSALQEEREFSLLCAYGLTDFPHAADHRAFMAVCDAHDRVFPSTPPEVTSDPVKTAVRFAQLEQLASCAERETALRRLGEYEIKEAQRAVALPLSFGRRALPSPSIVCEVDDLLAQIVRLTEQAQAQSWDAERTTRLLCEIRKAAQSGSSLLAASSLMLPDVS